MLCGVRRFFYFSHTIKSVFLRSYGWHLDLSMPWASRAGRSVSSLSKSQKQASTLPLCPQFSPAHRRTTCAGLFYIVFMVLLSLVRRRHYYRQPVPHLMATQVYSPVCGLYVTVTSYPFSVIASTHAYASAFFFVLKVTTSFAILYWIVSVFLDTVT